MVISTISKSKEKPKSICVCHPTKKELGLQRAILIGSFDLATKLCFLLAQHVLRSRIVCNNAVDLDIEGYVGYYSEYQRYCP